MPPSVRTVVVLIAAFAFLVACSPSTEIARTAKVSTPAAETDNVNATSTASWSVPPTIPDMTVAPGWTLSNQYQITLVDNGRTFTYTVTSRFLLYLDKTRYPKNEQVCRPDGIASWVSNGMGLYDEKLKLDSVGFETVKPGVCVIRIGDFRVVIQVVE